MAQGVVPAPDGGYPGDNTAVGQNALLSLTAGTYNTGVGLYSLLSNTDGSFNTAVGAGTLIFNTTNDNTAFGAAALLFNTDGSSNTAVGAFALSNNIDGVYNTAVGDSALFSHVTECCNNAVGVGALFENQSGESNNAFGTNALGNNVSGSGNTAVGHRAGLNQDTGSGNVYIGADMLGVAGENDQTYIRNINTTTVSGGSADSVTVDLTTGLLGHLSSSRRYKEDIKPMNDSSETLYRLQPVIYRYKKEIDRKQSLDYGLVAEDVARVDPNLVVRDRNGQIESVRYTVINAMLLNEFLKEHKKVQQQQATIAELKSTVAQQRKAMEVLMAQLKEQGAQIQKVSAQVELGKSTPQTAAIK